MKLIEPLNVIYQGAEDRLIDTVKPRLELIGVDDERTFVVNESKSYFLRQMNGQKKRLKNQGKIADFKPHTAHLGDRTDMNREMK